MATATPEQVARMDWNRLHTLGDRAKVLILRRPPQFTPGGLEKPELRPDYLLEEGEIVCLGIGWDYAAYPVKQGDLIRFVSQSGDYATADNMEDTFRRIHGNNIMGVYIPDEERAEREAEVKEILERRKIEALKKIA